MKNMTANTKLFIAAIVTAGALALASGLMRWESKDPVRFLSFLIVAAIASRLKVKLPGTTGNLSVNLPFILIALAELSFSETVVMAAVSAFVQGLPAIGRRMKPVQVGIQCRHAGGGGRRSSVCVQPRRDDPQPGGEIAADCPGGRRLPGGRHLADRRRDLADRKSQTAGGYGGRCWS